MAEPPAFPPSFLEANHNTLIITVCVLLSALSTSILCMRLWSTIITRRGFGADDFLLVGSWICATAISILTAVAIKFRVGWHIESLDAKDIVGFEKAFFVEGIVHPTTLVLAKLSMLVFLHRLFVTPGFRLTTYILGFVVISWWLTLVIGEFLICRPINSHWDSNVPGHCGNQQLFDKLTPIPWLITDFAILLCPLPVLKSLQLSKSRKSGLYVMFLIGFITCVVTCFRYWAVYFTLTDPTWDVVPAALLSVAEGNVTVSCAAIIASRPALSLFYPDKLILSARAQWSSFVSTRSGTRSHINITNNSNLYDMDTPLNNLSTDQTGKKGILVSQGYEVEYTNKRDSV